MWPFLCLVGLLPYFCGMIYTQVVLAVTDATVREMLIAELEAAGFEGFVEDNTELQAFINKELYKEEELKEIAAQYEVNYTLSEIAQQNWNAEWESGFSPVTVDGFCTIRADFHEPDTTVLHDIIITPKMSFGTGHHATTQLMVQTMKDIDHKDKKVLDFGTGTGVLAILAEKLGATSIMAIDNDEWSYENTLENIERNSAVGIEVRKGSLEVVEGETYDIILANINRHILIQCMQDMKNMLKVDGMVLMSGILVEDEGIVTSEAAKAGLLLKSKLMQDNWLCLSFSL